MRRHYTLNWSWSQGARADLAFWRGELHGFVDVSFLEQLADNRGKFPHGILKSIHPQVPGIDGTNLE